MKVAGWGDGCVPGFAALQGAWPGPARRWPSQQTPRLPGHAYPGGMRWAQWPVSGSRARVGWECGLRAWAWGRGKRGPDASLAVLAGLAEESWSATRAAASLLLRDGMGVGLPVSQ